MKIVTVIGTRPQFIKSSALTKIIKKQRKIDEIIIDTGQHYDHQMSSIFLKDLNIPKPK
jgi:UDP-GlcNAc3NAcA epimerase